MAYSRHTMGQDWGGRRKENPGGCPKVTGKQVREFAESHGLIIKNDGMYRRGGTWWLYDKNMGEFLTLASTNYLALERMKAEIQ